MNILQIAKTCHEVHRTYCKSIGHETQPCWEETSQEHKNVVVNSVEKIISSDIKVSEESHKNYVIEKMKQGWVYGETYSIENKTNPRIVPYEDLSTEQRTKEELFFTTVKSFI